MLRPQALPTSDADAVRAVLDDCFEQVCIVDDPDPPPPPSVQRPPRPVGLLLQALLGEQGPMVCIKPSVWTPITVALGVIGCCNLPACLGSTGDVGISRAVLFSLGHLLDAPGPAGVKRLSSAAADWPWPKFSSRQSHLASIPRTHMTEIHSAKRPMAPAQPCQVCQDSALWRRKTEHARAPCTLHGPPAALPSASEST
jgi:hypothetical protein